jgi:hypothetical protein
MSLQIWKKTIGWKIVQNMYIEVMDIAESHPSVNEYALSCWISPKNIILKIPKAPWQKIINPRQTNPTLLLKDKNNKKIPF